VNDTLGHAAGDELLRKVARRLKDAVRPDDLVARLGGDEFAVFLDGLTGPALGFTIAERIVAALAEPVEIGDSWAHVGASVGLAQRMDDSTAEGLMREADVAMYAAKARGKNRVEGYDADLDEVAVTRHLLRAELNAAVAGHQLVVEYQPIVHLETGRLVGLRHSCAGSTRRGVSCPRWRSSTWPRSPARSSASAPGFWRPPVVSCGGGRAAIHDRTCRCP